MGVVLIGEIKQGYGHSPMHLFNKCETGDKTEERTKWKSILFSLFLLSNEIVSRHDEIFTSFR